MRECLIRFFLFQKIILLILLISVSDIANGRGRGGRIYSSESSLLLFLLLLLLLFLLLFLLLLLLLLLLCIAKNAVASFACFAYHF